MYQNIHKVGNSVPVKRNEEDSLVVQWLRICLTVQGTCVQSQLGKIPRAVGQQSPCTTTTRGAQSLCSTTREAAAMRSPHTTVKSGPHPVKRKSAHSNRDPTQPKIKKYIRILRKSLYTAGERLPGYIVER